MRGDIGPDPLDQEPLKAFSRERGETKVTEIIFRLRYGQLVDWDMVFLLESFGPAVSSNSFSINGSNWSSQFRQEFLYNSYR